MEPRLGQGSRLSVRTWQRRRLAGYWPQSRKCCGYGWISRSWSGFIVGLRVLIMTENSPSSTDLQVRRQLSLWDVITLLSGAVVLGNAWAAAKILSTGLAGKAVAIIVGLIVGAACVWVIRTIGSLRIVDSVITARTMGKRRMWPLYICAATWLPVSGFVGYQVAKWGLQVLGF